MLHYQLINTELKMANTKYYLDQEGVIRVLQKISKEIRDNTSNKIEVTISTDPETGKTIRTPKKPNNFATNQAVVDYVGSKEKLIINQQSAVEDVESGYNVENNITEYNGNDPAQINLKLVDYTDIQSLFI